MSAACTCSSCASLHRERSFAIAAEIAQELKPRIKAVVVVSAHWESVSVLCCCSVAYAVNSKQLRYYLGSQEPATSVGHVYIIFVAGRDRLVICVGAAAGWRPDGHVVERATRFAL